MSKRKIVLGAGISGLGVFSADNTVELYEKEAYAGGLCSGFTVNDFYFDKAVHLSFSKNELVNSIFKKTEYITHYPMPKSHYHNKWLKHPAQNNLFPLEPKEKVAAIKGFINRDYGKKCDNFKEWIISRYGEYLYENLFRPYNRKYWRTDLKCLDVSWIENRLYQPSLDELLYGSFSEDTPTTYYAKEMRYPMRGGYYAFIKPIVSEIETQGKIHYLKEAIRIDTKQKVVYFKDGEEVYYDELFSSIPMSELVQIVMDVPYNIESMAQKLVHTSVAIVSIGLKFSKLKELWFYIYDDDIMAARAHMPSEKSNSNVPEGYESIQFEIYFQAGKEWINKDMAIQNCVYALEKLHIANSEDILFADFRVLPYGNVIFSLGTQNIVDEIKSFLLSKEIHLIGRFGRWEYLWSDQAFLSGYIQCGKQ